MKTQIKNFEHVETNGVHYLTFDLSEIGRNAGALLLKDEYKFDDGSLTFGDSEFSFDGLDFEPNFVAAIDDGSVVWSIATDVPVKKSAFKPK